MALLSKSREFEKALGIYKLFIADVLETNKKAQLLWTSTSTWKVSEYITHLSHTSSLDSGYNGYNNA